VLYIVADWFAVFAEIKHHVLSNLPRSLSRQRSKLDVKAIRRFIV